MGVADHTNMATHAEIVSLGFPSAVTYLRRKPGVVESLWPLAQAHDPEFVPRTDHRRASVSSSTYRPEVGPLSQVRLSWSVAFYCLIIRPFSEHLLFMGLVNQ